MNYVGPTDAPIINAESRSQQQIKTVAYLRNPIYLTKSKPSLSIEAAFGVRYIQPGKRRAR